MKNIKVLIKGYLKNITENEIFYIDAKGIYNKDKIKFTYDNTKYTFNLNKDNIIMNRESDDFISNMYFKENNKSYSNYLVKENNLSLDIEVLTKALKIRNNLILINYYVIDSETDYEVKIEMSDTI